ncbi:MAG: hypothetical protein KME16_26110 [Scytolyngbya sp. HA4215-MV1]|nr:hypothetical protein [Scytolyngbya sp. HA4215-MV1]
MLESMKNRVTSEVDKVKATGGTRVARIRDIVKEATAQVVAEFKEGKGEIEALSKTAFSTVIQELDEANPSTIAKPVEVIAPSIESPLQTTESVIPPTNFSSQNPEVRHDFADEKVEEVTSGMADTPSWQALLTSAFYVVKQRLLSQFHQKSGTWKEQVQNGLQNEYVDLKNRVIHLDGNLTDRYGDRYATAKQRLSKVASWYETAQAQQTEVQGSTVVQQQQTVFESKAAEVGATVAQKEQQLRQRLKTFLTTAAAKL